MISIDTTFLSDIDGKSRSGHMSKLYVAESLTIKPTLKNEEVRTQPEFAHYIRECDNAHA